MAEERRAEDVEIGRPAEGAEPAGQRSQAWYETTGYAAPKPRTEPTRPVRRAWQIGLQGRFILFVAAATLMPVVAVWLFVEPMRTSAHYGELIARGESSSRLLATAAAAGFASGDKDALLSIALELSADPGVSYVCLQDGEGALAAWAGPPEALKIVAGDGGARAGELRPGRSDRFLDHDKSGHPIRVLEFTSRVESPSGGTDLGWARVALSVDGVAGTARAAQLRIMLVVEIVLVLACAGAFFLMRQLTVPIRNLVDATVRASRGDFISRLAIPRGGEIGELSKNFNNMIEQIRQNQGKIEELNRSLENKVKTRTLELENSNLALRRAFQELKQAESQMILSEKMASLGQLVAGVAHEINTPTSAINAAADTLHHDIAEVGRQMRVISSIRLEPDVYEKLHDLLVRITAAAGDAPRVSLESVRQESHSLEEMFEESGLGDQRELSFALARLGLADATRESIDVMPEEQGAQLLPLLRAVATMSSSIGDILYSVDAIMRMVKALKAYSHLDQAETTEVNLHDGLETTLIILHNHLRFGVEVLREYGTIPTVRGNPSELNQVWTNILMNAVQAMDGRGIISIRTVHAEGYVSVRITDNGPGIPPAILDRIFDPFFTTKEQGEGSGLGLAICQQLVRRNRGRMTVESRPGLTCFDVRLPSDEAPEGGAR